MVCGNSPSAPEGITSKVLLNLLTNMVCPSLPVHLVLAPVFGGVRVAHLLLVLCVFSFISYVLLVVFVSVFIASSLSLDSSVLDFALTVVTLDFHPIGEAKDGKISIIVRFLTYRQRHMVFSNKRKLKGNKDKMFIAENLTKYRYDLLRQLNGMKKINKVHSFWTHDGSILVKERENSKVKVIKNQSDVDKME